MEKILDLIERDFYTIFKDKKPPCNEHWIFLVTVKIEWHFPNKEKKPHWSIKLIHYRNNINIRKLQYLELFKTIFLKHPKNIDFL